MIEKSILFQQRIRSFSMFSNPHVLSENKRKFIAENPELILLRYNQIFNIQQHYMNKGIHIIINGETTYGQQLRENTINNLLNPDKKYAQYLLDHYGYNKSNPFFVYPSFESDFNGYIK